MENPRFRSWPALMIYIIIQHNLNINRSWLWRKPSLRWTVMQTAQSRRQSLLGPASVTGSVFIFLSFVCYLPHIINIITSTRFHSNPLLTFDRSHTTEIFFENSCKAFFLNHWMRLPHQTVFRRFSTMLALKLIDLFTSWVEVPENLHPENKDEKMTILGNSLKMAS